MQELQMQGGALPTALRASVKIAKLLLQETGTYNPLYSRPYEVYISQESMNSICQRVEQTGGSSVTGSLLSGISSNIVAPSATPGKEIAIPYGWTERRIRFLMEVHITPPSGTPYLYYIQGYTNYLGVTSSGNIDPAMEFYINSFIRVSRCNTIGPYGVQVKDVITEAAHVVNGAIVHTLTGSDVYGMRPHDLFTGVHSEYLQNAYSYMQNGSGLQDNRITLNSNPVRAARANSLPSNYLANIIDNYQTGAQLATFGQGSGDIISRCRDLTYEAGVDENPFIRAISAAKGVPSSVTFNMNDLCRVDPAAASVTDFITLGATNSTELHQVGQTSGWNGSDSYTLAATILSNAVPAIMMDLMIKTIAFRSTNADISGGMTTGLYAAESFTSADNSANYELFKRRLERELLFDITHGNQELYQLDMVSNLFGETRVTISFNGGAGYTYTTPSFCDSLMTPMITTSRDNYFGVVHNVSTLMSELDGIAGGQGTAINMTV